MNWQVVPATLAILVAMTGGALSETIQIARAGQSVNVSGTSGGTVKAKGCAGYIAGNPNHVIKLAEASDLRFSLQGAGEPTLLINGPGGRTVCVMAEPGGKIEIPGLGEAGNYSVYVGDRVQGRHPYSI
ncbi:MAG: hypothetical protein VKJ46_10725 [Leptolyngbyaceae bacterium]|nr:hypothetical protein [Leptolyngbyaceae bacterium]